MFCDVHALVQHAADFDDSVGACPVKQEVAWAFAAADREGGAFIRGRVV
jgi:hypothetical protein